MTWHCNVTVCHTLYNMYVSNVCFPFMAHSCIAWERFPYELKMFDDSRKEKRKTKKQNKKTGSQFSVTEYRTTCYKSVQYIKHVVPTRYDTLRTDATTAIKQIYGTNLWPFNKCMIIIYWSSKRALLLDNSHANKENPFQCYDMSYHVCSREFIKICIDVKPRMLV